MYLPLLDNYLQRLDMSQTNLQEYLTPEIARASETLMGLILPIVVFTLLQSYRRFQTRPDSHDLRWNNKYNNQPSALDNRLSQASFDLDLSHRNSHYQQSGK